MGKNTKRHFISEDKAGKPENIEDIWRVNCRKYISLIKSSDKKGAYEKAIEKFPVFLSNAKKENYAEIVLVLENMLVNATRLSTSIMSDRSEQTICPDVDLVRLYNACGLERDPKNRLLRRKIEEKTMKIVMDMPSGKDMCIWDSPKCVYKIHQYFWPELVNLLDDIIAGDNIVAMNKIERMRFVTDKAITQEDIRRLFNEAGTLGEMTSYMSDIRYPKYGCALDFPQRMFTMVYYILNCLIDFCNHPDKEDADRFRFWKYQLSEIKKVSNIRTGWDSMLQANNKARNYRSLTWDDIEFR